MSKREEILFEKDLKFHNAQLAKIKAENEKLSRVAQAARALLIHIQSDGDYRLTSKTFNRGAEAQGMLDDLQAALDALDKAQVKV